MPGKAFAAVALLLGLGVGAVFSLAAWSAGLPPGIQGMAAGVGFSLVLIVMYG